MMLILLGVEAAPHMQLTRTSLEQLHRLDESLAALVPNESTDETEAHLALWMRALGESTHMIGAHAIVAVEQAVRVKFGRVDHLLAQEATRAGAQVRGLVSPQHGSMALHQVRVFIAPSRLRNKFGNRPEQLAGFLGGGNRLQAPFLDAQETTGAHALFTAFAIRSNQLHTRTERPVIVHRQEGGTALFLRELDKVGGEVDEVLEVHHVGTFRRQHTQEGCIGPLIDEGVGEAAVVQAIDQAQHTQLATRVCQAFFTDCEVRHLFLARTPG